MKITNWIAFGRFSICFQPSNKCSFHFFSFIFPIFSSTRECIDHRAILKVITIREQWRDFVQNTIMLLGLVFVFIFFLFPPYFFTNLFPHLSSNERFEISSSNLGTWITPKIFFWKFFNTSCFLTKIEKSC